MRKHLYPSWFVSAKKSPQRGRRQCEHTFLRLVVAYTHRSESTHFAWPNCLAVQMHCTPVKDTQVQNHPYPYPTVEHGHISKVVFVFCNVMRICR